MRLSSLVGVIFDYLRRDGILVYRDNFDEAVTKSLDRMGEPICGEIVDNANIISICGREKSNNHPDDWDGHEFKPAWLIYE